MDINQIEQLRSGLQTSFQSLIQKIGPIQIGTPEQFPYGWRKSAKGRTVWRIVEEVITQNLELSYLDFNLDSVETSQSEVTVYDMKCTHSGLSAYINIKSAVVNSKTSKDDISKAEGLTQFYDEVPERQFFVATFFIAFNANMTIEIKDVVVFPVAWIPDVYVNPSNNGNLQSSHYKDLNDAVKRTNAEFLVEFNKARALAIAKKNSKMKQEV